MVMITWKGEVRVQTAKAEVRARDGCVGGSGVT